MDSTEALYEAAEDWNLLSRSVWKLRFWRTWPQWSTPPECLRLVLHPKWTNERKPAQRHGV
eukprot:9049178-Pyramimonas_sp.AAC.1